MSETANNCVPTAPESCICTAWLSSPSRANAGPAPPGWSTLPSTRRTSAARTSTSSPPRVSRCPQLWRAGLGFVPVWVRVP